MNNSDAHVSLSCVPVQTLRKFGQWRNPTRLGALAPVLQLLDELVASGTRAGTVKLRRVLVQ